MSLTTRKPREGEKPNHQYPMEFILQNSLQLATICPSEGYPLFIILYCIDR